MFTVTYKLSTNALLTLARAGTAAQREMSLQLDMSPVDAWQHIGPDMIREADLSVDGELADTFAIRAEQTEILDDTTAITAIREQRANDIMVANATAESLIGRLETSMANDMEDVVRSWLLHWYNRNGLKLTCYRYEPREDVTNAMRLADDNLRRRTIDMLWRKCKEWEETEKRDILPQIEAAEQRDRDESAANDARIQQEQRREEEGTARFNERIATWVSANMPEYTAAIADGLLSYAGMAAIIGDSMKDAIDDTVKQKVYGCQDDILDADEVIDDVALPRKYVTEASDALAKIREIAGIEVIAYGTEKISWTDEDGDDNIAWALLVDVQHKATGVERSYRIRMA